MKRKRDRRKNRVCWVLALVLAAGIGSADVMPAAAAQESCAGEEPSYAESIADAQGAYAQDQLIAVYDSDASNRQIRSEIAAVGSVSDLTAGDEQKTVLVDLAMDDRKAAEILEKNREVEFVQPNYRYRVQADAAPGGKADPYLDERDTFNYQYFFKTTNAEEAWNLVEAEEDHGQTTVGIVDTGVDVRHEDLKANLVTLDAKGHFKGFSCGEESDLDDDLDAHGTHIAGIIAAEYNNGLGGCGVASGHHNDLVRVLMSAAVSDDWLYTYDVCRAIDFNVSKGARVISMSFAGSGEDAVMERCIRQHYFEDGVVFVAASGNDESDVFCSPADFSTVIAVNATDEQGKAVYWSNYGRGKDISAPGMRILSTTPGDQYEAYSGTSMAAPIIAGICGLVLDMNADLSPAQVKNILCATTKEAQAGIDFQEDLAYGQVDAAAAVTAAAQEAAAGAAGETIAPEKISIKENADAVTERVVIPEGKSIGLTALVHPAACTQPVRWRSDNEAVAAVDDSGRVTGVSASPEDVRITASCGGKSASAIVHVSGITPASSVSIEYKEEYEDDAKDPTGGLVEGDTGMFGIQTEPEGAAASGAVFTSSDDKVLFVDSNGAFVAKKPGRATVTLWDDSGNREDANRLDQMKVTVRQEVEKITFTKKTNLLEVGQSWQFRANAVDDEPSDGIAPYHSEISYTVTNGNGAIHRTSGVFTAKKPGCCYVVAKTENDIYRACKVQIVKKNYAGADYALKAGKSVKKGRAKVKLSWKAVPCAVKYQVQKKASGGKWKTIKTVKKTGYTDKKFSGTSRYRVRACYQKFGKTGYYGWSKTVKVKK